MPGFNIPVVFKVTAETQEEAEAHVIALMHEGFFVAQENLPEHFKAIKYWDFAEIRWRKGVNDEAGC